MKKNISILLLLIITSFSLQSMEKGDMRRELTLIREKRLKFLQEAKREQEVKKVIEEVQTSNASTSFKEEITRESSVVLAKECSVEGFTNFAHVNKGVITVTECNVKGCAMAECQKCTKKKINLIVWIRKMFY